MRDKYIMPLIGRKRGGKSFLSEALANAANREGKTVLAYNAGLEDDFSDYHSIRFLSKEDTEEMLFDNNVKKSIISRYKRFPKCDYFDLNGKIYMFKDFHAVTKGMKLRCFRVDRNSEDMFFLSLYKYALNLLFIADDARVIVRNGVQSNLANLMARSDHTGMRSSTVNKKNLNGTDIIMIFHGFDRVNPEVWDYATLLGLYNSAQEPQGGNFDSEETFQIILKCWKELSDKAMRGKQSQKYDGKLINLLNLTERDILGEQTKKLKDGY